MNTEIINFERLIASEYGSTAGIVVLKKGKTVYENYLNGCAPDCPIHVFSVTKSVISLLIGIAIEKGFIAGIHQKNLDFFPDYTPGRGEKTLQTIALRDLLTMTAPYKYRAAPYTAYFASGDWVKSALDLLGGRDAPGEFRCTPLIGPDILSGILVRATGQPVRGFAEEHLFSLLGISVKRDIVFQNEEEHFAFLNAKGISGWVTDPKGIHTAGWGLTLTVGDMAKIGLLTLNGGVWAGKQIVPAAWIQESTTAHSHWDALNLSFGYLWWTNIGNGYAAMGDSGNVIYVNPEKKMVAAIASLYHPPAKDRTALITQHIEPLFS